METEKSFSVEEAEKDFCGRLIYLAAIFPFSNEKACLGGIAKTDFFYRLSPTICRALQSVEKVQPSWAFLRLYDKMVLGDERCWNAEKWIAES